jgi:hypothetical protein
MSIEEWFLAAPRGIRAWMCTPDFLKFASEQQSKSFQMAGMYDGAMSEACKELFKQQHEAIGALRVSIAVHGE